MSNKTSDKNVTNDSVIAHKFAVMQQQINEKDKRIQELEEESRKKSIELICYQEELENSIPKQAVIDKIEEVNQKKAEYNEYKIQGKETDVEYYENITNTAIVQVLTKLLEGERK